MALIGGPVATEMLFLALGNISATPGNNFQYLRLCHAVSVSLLFSHPYR